jgi:hypothetical protein
MSKLDPKESFLHVINEHRWLAAGGCAWNLVGPKATGEIKDAVDKQVPNISVLIQDSVLMHSRSLIDFYTKPKAKPKAKSTPDSTDITLEDFGLPLDTSLYPGLEGYRRPIEVHLLHLTDWRDSAFRATDPKRSAATDRYDWNTELSTITESILETALKDAANRGSKGWQLAFEALYQASIKRYRDKSFQWPTELGEKADVYKFLTSLGL